MLQLRIVQPNLDFAANDGNRARLYAVRAGDWFHRARGVQVVGIWETVGDDGGFEREIGRSSVLRQVRPICSVCIHTRWISCLQVWKARPLGLKQCS